jgi:protein involved in polysaccharide export with SLBB domain
MTRFRAILLAAMALPAAAQAQHATSAAPPPRDCSGRLAALLPECKNAASKDDPEKPAPVRRAPVEPSASPIRTPVKTPAPPPVAPPREPEPEPEPLPPETQTEFERFAATATGERLPVFGATLFDRPPNTFTPVERVPVSADYVIGPGDELLLKLWGPMNLDLQLTVDRAGAVFLPQAGSATVAGLRYQQLHDYLRRELERVFRNFDFTVTMGQLRSIDIFVVGRVRRPGTYTVSSLSTVVSALFASGGPSPRGSMRRIQLKRQGRVVAGFDLYDLLLNGDQSKDCRLLPGDVVYVPAVGPQVAVAGSVKEPAIYELNGEKQAGQVFELAGGLTAIADGQRGTIDRVRGRASLETVEFRLDEDGLRTPVQDGDVVRVLNVVPRFANSVTLRGNVANPARYPWREGMRLRDILPDKELLVTREYWTRRNALALAPKEPPPSATEPERKPARTTVETVADINWSYAVIERRNSRDLSAELIPFHPGKLLLEGDDAQNLALRPGDVVTLFSQADVRVAMAQQTRFVRLEGEFNAAGVYAVRPGETLGQLIERAGGFTPNAYLYGAELLRDSTRLDQQRRLEEFTRDLEAEVEQTAALRAGAAASADETAALAARLDTQRRFVDRLHRVQATGRIVLNFEPADRSTAKLMEVTLEDGDRFVAPARPATVNVLGAVYNQNSFLHEPALRAAGYLRNAGGPTRNADTGHAFIIRADGRIVPRQGTHGFDALRLSPGDSLVVPEQIFKGSFLRGLRDWTQVFSQMALGAAAINILR